MALKYKFNLKDISVQDFKVYFLGMFKSILSTDISFENFDLITVLLGFFSAFFTTIFVRFDFFV